MGQSPSLVAATLTGSSQEKGCLHFYLGSFPLLFLSHLLSAPQNVAFLPFAFLSFVASVFHSSHLVWLFWQDAMGPTTLCGMLLSLLGASLSDSLINRHPHSVTPPITFVIQFQENDQQ